MEATLDTLKRESFGKNEARRLRAQGRIPAVLYGGQKAGENAEPIAVDPKVLMRILHSDSGLNTLISLNVNGSSTRVLVKEYQVDPVTHKLLHVDFYRIAMDKLLTVTVPVVVKGEPKGVKQQGGVLDFVHREVEVECLPADIPDKIEIDVSELLLNESIRVRDIAPNPKFKAPDRRRRDARPRDDAEGRGAGADRGGCGRGRDGGAGRAGSHQEGQGREAGRRGREEVGPTFRSGVLAWGSTVGRARTQA